MNRNQLTALDCFNHHCTVAGDQQSPTDPSTYKIAHNDHYYHRFEANMVLAHATVYTTACFS